MSPKQPGGMQATFPRLCLLQGCAGAVLRSQELLFVLPGCLGKELPDGPLPSLA